MSSEIAQSSEFYKLVAWVDANRKRIAWIGGIIVAVVLAVSFYFWNKDQQEVKAAQALSALELRNSSSPGDAAVADGYLKLAAENPNTAAAARALLTGAGLLFDAGKFKEAQAQFEKFLSDYSDNPLSAQAALGVAASLEAKGSIADAITRYSEVIQRHPNDPSVNQAKVALARLYVTQNKPEQAFKIYDELARNGGMNSGDSWSAEAAIQREELLDKYPNLRPPAPKPAAVAPAVSPAAPPVSPLQSLQPK
jgi:predicted negative regulator of RcsB-dependent stress response